jgi:PPOX class probable F420-dependent enzyme
MALSRAAPSVTGVDGKYLSLTSYKRDGSPVATPLWFVQDGARLFVSTGRDSAKVRRIARNPVVSVAACSASGRLRGDAVPAHARIATDEERRRALELMDRKYRFDRVVILPVYRLVQRLRGRPVGGDGVVLAIDPGP